MTREMFFSIGFVILVLIAGVYTYTHIAPNSGGSTSNEDDAAVRSFVEQFGSRFKNVSLLAPDAQTQLDAEFGAQAAPELVATWQNNLQDAPGRLTSSPWPDRIEVVSVVQSAPNIYQVEGNLIEVAGADGSPEPVAVQPVSITIQKKGTGIYKNYVVTAFSRGTYSALPQRQTIVGYWECLPHKDTTGPQTTECAFGIAVDQSDGHYAVDTSLMSTYPVDFATGTKVRVEGVVTPVEMLSSIQKYDIDGVIRATTIEEI